VRVILPVTGSGVRHWTRSSMVSTRSFFGPDARGKATAVCLSIESSQTPVSATPQNAIGSWRVSWSLRMSLNNPTN
jgi:hypothetical protein